MPTSGAQSVTNKFNRGFVTEATGLTFPDDAVTDSLNVKFDPIGFVERRLGIDLEGSAEALSYSDDVGVVKEFVWTALTVEGEYTFIVLQTGSVVHFFQVSTDSQVSANIFPTSISLGDFKAPGSPALNMVPCSFASGKGYLFISHPYCDPILVRFKPETTAIEGSRITIKIRDVEGIEDNLKPGEEPDALTKEHNYNLLNQGWDQKVRVGTVSNELGDPSTGTTSAPPPVLNWRDFALTSDFP